MNFIMSHFEITLAAITFIWAISSFIISRNKELAWKKTEFIIQQSELLDKDEEMREITLILYGKNSQKSVADFLNLSTKSISNQDGTEFILQFEKYLNFFWRISYTFLVLKTLSKKDMNAFGAYFKAIYSNKELRDFCVKEGYDEIVTAYEKFALNK
jgi:hypothetical protein